MSTTCSLPVTSDLGRFDSADRQELPNFVLRKCALAAHPRGGAKRDQAEGLCQSRIVVANFCYIGQTNNRARDKQPTSAGEPLPQASTTPQINAAIRTIYSNNHRLHS